MILPTEKDIKKLRKNLRERNMLPKTKRPAKNYVLMYFAEKLAEGSYSFCLTEKAKFHNTGRYQYYKQMKIFENML